MTHINFSSLKAILPTTQNKLNLPECVIIDHSLRQVSITKGIKVRTELLPLFEQAVACLPPKTYVRYGIGQGFIAWTFKDEKGEVITKYQDGEWGWTEVPPLEGYTQYRTFYFPYVEHTVEKQPTKSVNEKIKECLKSVGKFVAGPVT